MRRGLLTWFLPQRGSLMMLIVGPQLVSASAEWPGAHFPAFVSARISRPVPNPLVLDVKTQGQTQKTKGSCRQKEEADEKVGNGHRFGGRLLASRTC